MGTTEQEVYEAALRLLAEVENLRERIEALEAKAFQEVEG
jgi:hypothetical protein